MNYVVGEIRMSNVIVYAFTLLFLATSFTYTQSVVVIKLDGAINPAATAFIERGIEEALDKKAQCLIVELNTPGGLLKSTRVIVSTFLESKVPIVVYVSPPGSHAGSAGVFITMAAHIAAMAPGTNIGAAHPVNVEGKMDSVMAEKVTNDAAAFIRTIAEKRQRNLKWAEDAVRKSQSITETEALDTNVIDIVAKNLNDLLTQIDGKKVVTVSGTITLETKNASIDVVEMDWAEKILDLLSSPNLAIILFQLGVIGLMLELYNPGSIFPGVVGVICLILAFYAMHTLPINYAGLALMIFGIILFLLELKITSHGMLTIGGVISLFLGSIMLIRTSSMLEFVEISLTVIILSVAISTLFFAFVLGYGLRILKRKPSTGIEGIVGEIGEALTEINPIGMVRVHGEIWNAESIDGNISKGEQIQITGIEKLKLKISRLSNPH